MEKRQPPIHHPLDVLSRWIRLTLVLLPPVFILALLFLDFTDTQSLLPVIFLTDLPPFQGFLTRRIIIRGVGRGSCGGGSGSGSGGVVGFTVFPGDLFLVTIPALSVTPFFVAPSPLFVDVVFAFVVTRPTAVTATRRVISRRFRTIFFFPILLRAVSFKFLAAAILNASRHHFVITSGVSPGRQSEEGEDRNNELHFIFSAYGRTCRV